MEKQVGISEFPSMLDVTTSHFHNVLCLSEAKGMDIKMTEQRSEERRVGKECLRLCRSRWSPYH